VTPYVQRVLAPRVLELEGALATANRQVLAYCAPRGQEVSVCFEGNVNAQDSALLTLGQALDTQSLVLTQVSADLAALPVPDVGAPLPSWQADRLIEDLASGSAQFAALLQEYATAIRGAEGAPLPTGGVSSDGCECTRVQPATPHHASAGQDAPWDTATDLLLGQHNLAFASLQDARPAREDGAPWAVTLRWSAARLLSEIGDSA
jgi:hypothetical protein